MVLQRHPCYRKHGFDNITCSSLRNFWRTVLILKIIRGIKDTIQGLGFSSVGRDSRLSQAAQTLVAVRPSPGAKIPVLDFQAEKLRLPRMKLLTCAPQPLPDSFTLRATLVDKYLTALLFKVTNNLIILNFPIIFNMIYKFSFKK